MIEIGTWSGLMMFFISLLLDFRCLLILLILDIGSAQVGYFPQRTAYSVIGK